MTVGVGLAARWFAAAAAPCSRRAVLAAACALPWVAHAAQAGHAGPGDATQPWPLRPVRLLVAYPGGGVSDQVARRLAERLAAQLGVPVTVENRPGAAGTLALRLLARHPPDGHLLCFSAATAAASLAGNEGSAGQPSGVLPVAGVMRTPLLIVGTPALRAHDFAGLLALARHEPGGIRWATTGEGSTGHLVLERVRRAAGLTIMQIVHIPYKGGGQQLGDAMAGHFEVLSTNVAPAQLEAIRAGRLVALAVGAAGRLRVLPTVPTLAELGYADANLDSLFGLFAAAGTPAAVVERINAEVALALGQAPLRSALEAADNQPFVGSAAAFGRQVAMAARR